MNNLLSKILPPYDAGIYEVPSVLDERPITIHMQNCNYNIVPNDVFHILIEDKEVLQQSMTKNATITRFGVYQFYDELKEEHIFGAVFYAKEK